MPFDGAVETRQIRRTSRVVESDLTPEPVTIGRIVTADFANADPRPAEADAVGYEPAPHVTRTRDTVEAMRRRGATTSAIRQSLGLRPGQDGTHYGLGMGL